MLNICFSITKIKQNENTCQTTWNKLYMYKTKLILWLLVIVVTNWFKSYKITGNSTTPITGAGHINVQPYHSLFLHSSLGLQNDCIGPDDSQSIIRKIVLDAAPGSMVNDFHSLPYDFVSVQPSQVRNLSFRLADYRGRTVDLQHQGFSFSLLFVDENEF